MGAGKKRKDGAMGATEMGHCGATALPLHHEKKKGDEPSTEKQPQQDTAKRQDGSDKHQKKKVDEKKKETCRFHFAKKHLFFFLSLHSKKACAR